MYTSVIDSAKRITVGTTGALFFSVKAEGDTWAEVVEKIIKEH